MPKKRWTISMMKRYRKFCGWDRLKELMNAVEIGMRGPSNEILIHNDLERREAQAAIATIFETGARVCEVLGQGKEGECPGIKASDIEERGDWVVVRFELEKRYKKIGKVERFKATSGSKMRWDTEEEAKRSGYPYEKYQGFMCERVLDLRTVALPKYEPLVPIMLSWAGEIAQEGKEKKLFDIKYNRFYRITTEAGKRIGEEFPPHRLRAERSTQLVLEYGMSDGELTEWESWRPGGGMAHEYTTLAPRTEEKMMKAKELFKGT